MFYFLYLYIGLKMKLISVILYLLIVHCTEWYVKDNYREKKLFAIQQETQEGGKSACTYSLKVTINFKI